MSGSWCEVVRADTDDLRHVVDRGAVYVSGLQEVFDVVAAARSRLSVSIGVSGAPPASVARLDGGDDSLAELVAEARLTNAFVTEIADALTTDSADSTVSLAPADVIDAALADAGLGAVGPNRSLTADRATVENWAVRRELAQVLAGLDEDIPDRYQASYVGGAIEDWLDTIDGSDHDRVAAVARVLVDRGIDLRAGLDDERADGPDGTVGAMLVTQGVLLWPDDRAELVGALAGRVVPTADGGHQGGLEALVDALDLDQTNGGLNAYGIGFGPWHRANQPWVRAAALTMLVEATIGPDGTIGIAGQRLVADVLDRYPSVVELADDAWHDRDPSDRYLRTADGRTERVWPTASVRATLGRALAAPNHGLTRAEYEAALGVDRLDAELAGAATRPQTQLGFNQLLAERWLLVDDLVGGDPDVAMLIDQAMADGRSASEALRLARFGQEGATTDDRVRRLRVLYPTTDWGDPVDPIDADHGLPADVARSLAAELGVLQTIQEARYAEGLLVPELPLTPEQVDLVRRYDEVATWFHNRFAWGWPGGAEAAFDHLAELDDGDVARLLPGAPDDFGGLLDELVLPRNQIVWDLLSGAAGNDTFLGPDGTFRPPDGNGAVLGKDAKALLVQLALLSTIGPHHGALDGDGDGVVHEDEVDRWLRANDGRSDVPPALVDRVRVGASYGLGQDTFGWEEIGELIGWVGLAAAVTATVVYSGGAAAPLWVKAGLVGLAGAEAYAFHQADDDWSAALAGVAGVGDLAAAARLIRRARAAQVAGPAEAIAAQRHYDELIGVLGRSEHPPLRSLVARTEELTPSEFLDQAQSVLDGQGTTLARRLIASGADPADAVTMLRRAGVDSDGLRRFVLREPVPGSVADANFAQNNVVKGDKAFSEHGQAIFGELAGYPVETVDDLVATIGRGDVDPAEIIVDFVILDGHQLILNTRTSTALRNAGIPQYQWTGRDQTGKVAFVSEEAGDEVPYDDLARSQLKRNGLPAEGSPTLGVDE